MTRPRRNPVPAFILLLVLLSASVPAAAADRDPAETRTWLDISARAKLAKGTSATLTQFLRWDGFFDSLYLFAPELSVRQRIQSWWRVEGGYRYLYRRDNDGDFQNRHRIFANTRFRARTSATALELRMQWQEQFRHEDDDGSARRQILRTRAKLGLRGFESIRPYTSLEVFHRLDGNDEDIPSGTLTKWRFVLGTKWGKKARQYNARYLLVIPVHRDRDPLLHTLSFGVRFNLS